ncbi:MAG: acyl-ACP thioesterase [Spirochaetaceae bacterium]|jgi:acyl-ACP thioesterase|nr:acyl-ACP thioesterase [Spirochaetaceae bacterium]
MDIYTEQTAVTLGDVDESNRVKPSAFFGYFQHATTLHGDELGIGAKTIARAGQGWVLSRFSVQIEKRPALSDVLTLSTWPRGFKRLFAIRDYLIKDDEGGIAVKARSGWLVIDTAKRRPLREESLHTPLPRNDDIPDTIPDGAEALPDREEMMPAGTVISAYSDTDFNGHVNNVRYVEWAQNYVSAAALAAEKLRVDINFVNEIPAGIEADIFTYTAEGLSAVEARRKDCGQRIFRAEFHF